MFFFVYILRSTSTGKTYIGQTNNLVRRVEQVTDSNPALARHDLSRSCRQMFEEIPRHEHSQMYVRPAPLMEPMIAIGIRHVIELFPKFDKTIHQSFRDLEVRVRLTRPVNNQQIPLQTFGETDGGGPAIPLRVGFAGLHVDLLEPRVIEMRLRFGRNGDPNVIHVRFPKHCIKRVRTPPAPAPDTDSRQVDVGPCSAQFLQAGRLFLSGERAKAAKYFRARNEVLRLYPPI